MISLLFLTRNRLGMTARCFRSLAPTLRCPDVEWRIVDNGSTDYTPAWLLKLAARHPRVHVTLRADNTGVAGGRQLLLEQAQGDIVVILDSDVEARHPDWLDRLIAPLANKRIGVCGPGGHWLAESWLWYDPAPPDYVGEVDTIAGYCQAIRREALNGFAFDMCFNPYWHEDTDTCLWLRHRGLIAWDTGDIGLAHIYAGSGDDGTGRAKQEYLASKWQGKGLVRFERAQQVMAHG